MKVKNKTEKMRPNVGKSLPKRKAPGSCDQPLLRAQLLGG